MLMVAGPCVELRVLNSDASSLQNLPSVPQIGGGGGAPAPPPAPPLSLPDIPGKASAPVSCATPAVTLMTRLEQKPKEGNM